MQPVEGELRVALLTPGPVSDSGWSAMAFDGLQAIKDELGAEVSNQVATDAQIKDSMRSYAQDGFNLIIGHGFEYNTPAVEVGKDFPNVAIVSSSGGESSANVGAFRFYLEQGFYVCGMLAGKMSKTGVVAMIGGPDVPSIRSTFKAFKAGAEAGRPDIKVIEIFTNEEADVAAAKQATLQAIGQKADFVIHQTNAAARGVFEACEEKDVWAFGSNLDQNGESPKILASAIIVAKPAFVNLAKSVRDGTFKGGITLAGMENGAIDFLVNPLNADKIPSDIRGAIDELLLKIKTGSFEVPKDEF